MQGPEGLGDDELLALAIGTGCAGLPLGEIASGLLSAAGGVAGLHRLPVSAMGQVPGLGPARAVRLHAALVLARRALVADPPGEPVVTAEQAASWFAPRLAALPAEELHALFLDRRHRVRACRSLTRGNDAHTIVDPRQVFREALVMGAAAVIVGHNHPSGDPTPSSSDVEVSLRLAEAGRVLGVNLLDHLVLGGSRWCSLREQGLLPPPGYASPPVAADGGGVAALSDAD